MDKINHLQAIIAAYSTKAQVERSASQMTLGKLISALGQISAERITHGFGFLHSYRGYYADLAFDPEDSPIGNVGDLLALCKNAMGKVFTGYKGGDFLMGETTPLWISEYGATGLRLIDLDTSKEIIEPITAPDEE